MKNIVIKGWMIAVAVFVVIFGGMLITIGTGDWSTTRDSEPARFASGEFNPADIRGSYTFAEIEQFFGVPLNALFEGFMIPDASRKPGFQVKNLEGGMFAPVTIDGNAIEVGTDLVRLFTALYSGLRYDTPESEYLPKSAVRVLVEAGKLDSAQQTYREKHSFELVLLTAAEIVAKSVEASAEIALQGRTTMGELLQYGITKEQFQAVTGVVMPGNAVGLRDFVTQNGLEMEPVKTGLQALLAGGAPETTAARTATPEASGGSDPAASAIDIKGSTSIAALLSAGLTAEQFADITGMAVPDDATMSLKNFVDANGLDMETVRTRILDTVAQ